MLTKYILWNTLAALAGDQTLTEIPFGAVVEAPAMLVAKGTVRIRYKEHLVTVLALDFLDSARLFDVITHP